MSPLPQILALLNVAREKRDAGDANAQVVEREARERIERLIAASALPEIGQPLVAIDGIYAGVSSSREQPHYVLVLLNAKPSERLTWDEAIEWAKSVGGELPTRPEAAMLFANVPDEFEKRWHWTSTQYSDAGAWTQYFNYGYQRADFKSYEGWARAVRRFDVQSFDPSVAA
jgi:hypothetical protein